MTVFRESQFLVCLVMFVLNHKFVNFFYLSNPSVSLDDNLTSRSKANAARARQCRTTQNLSLAQGVQSRGSLMLIGFLAPAWYLLRDSSTSIATARCPDYGQYYLSLSLYIYIYTYDIYIYTYIHTYIHTYLSIYLSIYLSMYLSIHLSLSLYIYIYIYMVHIASHWATAEVGYSYRAVDRLSRGWIDPVVLSTGVFGGDRRERGRTYIHISLSIYVYIYIYTHRERGVCDVYTVALSLSLYIYIYILFVVCSC